MPMKHHEISNAESLSLPIWALEDPYDPIDSFRLTDMYVYIYIQYTCPLGLLESLSLPIDARDFPENWAIDGRPLPKRSVPRVAANAAGHHRTRAVLRPQGAFSFGREGHECGHGGG